MDEKISSEKILGAIDAEILRISTLPLIDNTFHPIRRLVGEYIQARLNKNLENFSFPDLISHVASSSDHDSRRAVAFLLARISIVEGAIPGDGKTEREFAALFEKAAPDISKQLSLSTMRQTYEKIEAIRGVHARALQKLKVLAQCPTSLEEICAARTEINRSLADSLTNSYLSPYRFADVKNAVQVILAKICDLADTRDATYTSQLLELRELLNQHMFGGLDAGTFVHEDYFVPFLRTCLGALQGLESASRERFECSLRPRRSAPDIAEKHYPLHEVNRTLRVLIGFENVGPGVALDVRAELSTADQNLVFDEKLFLGDIRPGPFPLSFEILVVNSTKSESFALSLSWLEVGINERRESIFDFRLYGQNPGVNWSTLEKRHPYSAEVAEGSEFVGRQSKVVSVAARYLKERMASSFITGQKRVGKTSLAKAIQNYIEQSPEAESYSILYLEYGSYSHTDSSATVEALGDAIAEFLCADAGPEVVADKFSFKGSLAPLSRIADALIRVDSKRRYIIILDEFDEIHVDMYRYGALAETFFANLRAISAKRNIAFLLVGGERMPFVMSAQGDQLNRFAKEQLDYFSRVAEWDDYQELVRRPTNENLNWSAGAIARLFDLTNGHPYYTKLLCNRIYLTAVAERDSEITDAEVESAASRLVGELDANAFAHIWKDGIQQEEKEAEVVELRRRRLLSAIARALRSGKRLTFESIASSKLGLKLMDPEILPLVADFERRGFLRGVDAAYELTIPLFGDWLVAHGSAPLLSDALADEYESLVQKAEEDAHVSPAEIVSLTKSWHIYQGQNISPEAVRAWIEQVTSKQEQRQLFTILQNVRFFSTMEVREQLRSAHGMLSQFLRPFVQEKKVDRRSDVFVTYVDGLGKSGAHYAALYAEENRIMSSCVVPPENVDLAVAKHEEAHGSSISAVVVVDDFVGTGKSLAGNIGKFEESYGAFLRSRGIRLFVVALASTKEGEAKVRASLRNIKELDVDLRVCEVIQPRHYAFRSEGKIWKSADDEARAKELCLRIGRKVHKENFLGYGDSGLLVVFPNNCPNNSLPILHGDSSGDFRWVPLFPRVRR